MKKIRLLKNEIMNYHWGSKDFIPDLLGLKKSCEIPCAEMWMGSHKKAPSKIILDDQVTTLDLYIEKHPESVLGNKTADKFSHSLPFLFKILSAAKPLSIQAHPDKNIARSGFERENMEGIPMDAPDRNYRDNNHKPEQICALTTMWALKGFRMPEDTLRLLEPFHTLKERLGTNILKNKPNEKGIKHFFTNLLNMDKASASALIQDILNIVQEIKKEDPAYQWVENLYTEYPGDTGVLAPLYLNVLRLEPGETVYLPACELHAYLSGSGLEIMANSDNVLRGGLTTKHIDRQELLNVLSFKPSTPELNSKKETAGFESFFESPAEEFVLSVIEIPDTSSVYKKDGQKSVEIILCTDGNAVITDEPEGHSLPVKKGTSILIPAEVSSYNIKGKATIYKASVPL